MKPGIPKPILLRPMDPKKSRWFRMLVALAVMLVLLGWIFTIRRALFMDFSGFRTQIDTGIEKASGQLRQATDSAQDRATGVSEAFDQAQQAYQEEKQRQAQEKTDLVPDSETMNP